MAKAINKLKKNLLGLEIGSSSIKVVQADFSKEALVIRNVAVTALPDNVYSDGEITRPDVLVATIKDTLKKHKMRAKDCFCCADSSQIITREVRIPNLNKDNLQDMAKFEVEQYLPIEMDNYAVQSIVVREVEVDDKPIAEVLVTAFPKRLIAQVHEVISQTGLRPQVLDTQANAFGKFIEHQRKINGSDSHQDGITAFVDFGYQSINVHIFHKGSFRFSRVLPYGGRDLDTNISKFMDVELEDAKRMKHNINNINYAVDEMSEEAKMVNVVKSTFTSWLDEVGKIFRYYSSRSAGNNNIEYIYIFGGLANVNGLSDYIESYFKIPTNKFKKVSEVEFNQDIKISEVLNTLGVFYRR